MHKYVFAFWRKLNEDVHDVSVCAFLSVLRLLTWELTFSSRYFISKIRWHFQNVILGRPFVKRFALCYQTVVCPVCPACPLLSVTLVYCGQTVGHIKMKPGMQVGLGPGHIVLDGHPAPPSQRGAEPPQFSACICCGKLAGRIKMPLGMEVSLRPGDFGLHGDQPSQTNRLVCVCVSVGLFLWPPLLPFNVDRFWWNLVTRNPTVI